MGEIGAAIQETMESFEVEVGGKVFPGIYEFTMRRSRRVQMHFFDH